MSTVQAPQPPAPAPVEGPLEPPRPAPRRPLPAGVERVASPAIVLLTAGLILAASGWGNDLAGVTRAEIAAILGGGGLVVAALVRAGRVPGAWPVVALVALAALTALSILWSINSSESWLEANRTIAYCAAFAGAAALATIARERYAAFTGGVLLGVVLVCLLALLSKIVPEWLNETERFARLREPFGYWNAVGLSGALAVPGALWLGSRRQGSPAAAALAYPALTIALTTMLLAYSRGSLLAAAVGATVWFVLVPSRRLRGAATLLISAAAAAFVAAWTFGQNALTADRIELAERGAAGRELLVCIVAVLLLVYLAALAVGFLSDLRPLNLRTRRGLGIALVCGAALVPVGVAGMLASTDQGLGGSVSTAWKTVTDPAAEPPSNDAGRLTQTGSIRARYWDDAWNMAQDRPAAGWGAGGFGTVRPRYRRDTIDVQHAHGYVAQTLSDLGFIGLGLSLLLLITWLLAARTAIRATTGPRQAALITLMATALVFGAHSLVDWTWFTAGTALVGMLAAGWVAGSVPAAARAVVLVGRARLVAAVVVGLLVLSAAWAAWQPLRASALADDALAAADAGRVDTARDLAREAHDVNPLSAEPLQARAIIERAAGDEGAAERALNDAVRAQPASYTTWLRLAEFQLWVAERPRDALQSIRGALYLNPASFTVVQRYLDIYRTVQTREARERRRR